ncbi:MAG: hypothetical protein KGL39_19870, partial [Patescibacteria group bacterium]|nr:hypothetical protein [Patescibacteria group bacterium]
VAMTLLATAASDIFTQDLEDLPEEIVQAVEGSNPKPAPIADPQPKAKPAEQSAAKAMDKTDNTVTFIPVQISQKQGSKNGKDWTNFGIKSPEGEWYGTFSEQYGALAVQAKEDKKNLWIKFELKDGYKNVEELVLA